MRAVRWIMLQKKALVDRLGNEADNLGNKLGVSWKQMVDMPEA